MKDLKDGHYTASKPAVARGFVTTLEVGIRDGQVQSAHLDATNDSDNPYGDRKSTSEKYNDDMFVESGTYYRDAVKHIEESFEAGFMQVDSISGATVIAQDANDLMYEILGKQS